MSITHSAHSMQDVLRSTCRHSAIHRPSCELCTHQRRLHNGASSPPAAAPPESGDRGRAPDSAAEALLGARPLDPHKKAWTSDLRLTATIVHSASLQGSQRASKAFASPPGPARALPSVPCVARAAACRPGLHPCLPAPIKRADYAAGPALPQRVAGGSSKRGRASRADRGGSPEGGCRGSQRPSAPSQSGSPGTVSAH